MSAFVSSRWVWLILLGLCLPASLAADCVTIEQAAKKIGATACVKGKVVRVGQSRSGTYFLDFCDDWKKCPFTVVVFPRDVLNVGDVRKLEGKTIEVHGTIKQYKGRAEIILKDARQLHGEAAKLPPPPKQYDADRHGSYSAGRFRPESSQRKTGATREASADSPAAASQTTEDETGDQARQPSPSPQ